MFDTVLDRQPRRDRRPGHPHAAARSASARSPSTATPTRARAHVARRRRGRPPRPGRRPRESYLNIDRCSTPPRRTGAQAVHPGYGFLSENAAFAAACADAGITFIGPPPDAIATMGDKIQAKQPSRAAGVPVVPGRRRPGMTDARARSPRPTEIGYPGPGQAVGRRRRQGHARSSSGPQDLARRPGQRPARGGGVVRRRHPLPRAVRRRPRHIEVQVLADAHGNVGPPRRARVQPAAPAPEDRRGGAVAAARRRHARGASARPRSTPPGASTTSARARSSSSSSASGPTSSSSWR